MSKPGRGLRPNGDLERRSDLRSGPKSRNGSKFRYSKYAPVYDPKLPQIPSIDEFKLANIVQQHTLEETTQVVDSVRNVSKVFQQDLREEVRKKLSIEQRIQFKNIELSKLAHAVRKKNKARSLGPAAYHVDTANIRAEIEQLVQVSTTASQKARDLISTVKLLQTKSPSKLQTIDSTKYPTLYRLLQDKKLTKVSTTQTNTTMVPKTPIVHMRSSTGDTNPIPQAASSTPSDMSADEFEEFLSRSIAKYREQQKSRQKADAKMVEELDDGSSTTESAKLQFNPVKLLYSSILDTDSKNGTLGIKSTATSAQTLQTSHFKKLRINGSPITSATFKNMTVKPKCDCDNGDESPAKAVLEALSLSDADASPSVEYTSSDGVSDSSDDVSVSSDEFATHSTTTTNQYYSSLKRSLRQKKSKTALVKRASTGSFVRESSSPTPRHKPSHRTLKPKNSILKTKLEPAQRMAKKPIPPLIVPDHNDEGISGISFDSAQGTILQLEEETSDDDNDVRTYRGTDDIDTHSSRSAELLREFLSGDDDIMISSRD